MIKTRGLSGPIHKTARVYTNDAEKRLVTLTVKGFVKVPVLVSPRYISLRGYEGNMVSGFVTITAMEKKPLKLEPAGFDLSGMVTYRVEVLEPGKKFKIHFKSNPADAGTFRGVLKLRTNYPEKSLIYIPVDAKFRKKVTRKDRNKAEKATPEK